MDLGDFNKLVKIQRRGPARDDWGQPVPEEWQDFTSVWANVKHLSGAETLRADSPTSTARASIRILYRDDVDAGMQVLLKSKVYKITAVLPDEVDQNYVDLVCEIT